MPITASKLGPQVHFFWWKLTWYYPELNNPIGGRKTLGVGYCSLPKTGIPTLILIWDGGVQIFLIILSCHGQSQILVFGGNHHWIHYIMMVINKGLKSKKHFLCLQIFRNFISFVRKSRSLEKFNAFLRPCLHFNGNMKFKPTADIKTKCIQMREGFARSA